MSTGWRTAWRTCATSAPRRSSRALADEDDWVEHVNEVSKVSLRSTCSSWYVGTNIPGRPRVFMPYIGGFPIYVQKCNEVMSDGFEGFVLEGAGCNQRSRREVRLHRTMARAARHRGDLAGRRRRAGACRGVNAA